jgi:hypothetical protein
MVSKSKIYPDKNLTCELLEQIVMEQAEQLKLLKAENNSLKDEIKNLKDTRNDSSNLTDSAASWVTVTSRNLGKKKPQEQLIVVNAAINEQNERKKREKNVVIYGVEESTKETAADKAAEDKTKVDNIFTAIGKQNTVRTNIIRLKSRRDGKVGPIIVQLNNIEERNPVLLAAKSLRDKQDYAGIYIGTDMTEAERLLDYQLRKERDKLNGELEEGSPFRYAIRGNQIKRFKKQA